MLGKFSKFKAKKQSKRSYEYNWRSWWLILALPIWVLVSFYVVQFLLGLVLGVAIGLGVNFESIGVVAFNTIVSVIIYILTLLMVTLVPFYVAKRKTKFSLLGINDWPTMLELLVSPLAYVFYMIVSAILVWLGMRFLGVDINQEQALPFSQTMLVMRWQYVLAFTTVVVLAPLAEEVLFRGYLYGKLRNSFPIWVAVLVTSVAFGAAHLWGGADVPLQWAVAIDTFALSLVMCVAREFTGAIWLPVMMHMIKNGVAFYFMFVNPEFLNELKSAILPFI